MSLGIFCGAPFNSDEAWERFVLAHYLRHGTYRETLNAPITESKVDEITKGDQSWMLLHAQEHLDTCNAVGIQANPYIGLADLTVQAIYEQWMYQHKLEHENLDNALNL